MNFLQSFKQVDSRKSSAASAGLQLLKNYQNEWIKLRGNSVDSFNKAKDFSLSLEDFSSRIKQNEARINDFHVQLLLLPDLISHIDELASSLEKLEMSFLQVSCSLDLYEKVCREHDECNRKQAALREINELKMQKWQELESVKGDLARKHAERLSKLNAQQQSVAAERQKTIVDAIVSTKE